MTNRLATIHLWQTTDRQTTTMPIARPLLKYGGLKTKIESWIDWQNAALLCTKKFTGHACGTFRKCEKLYAGNFVRYAFIQKSKILSEKIFTGDILPNIILAKNFRQIRQ